MTVIGSMISTTDKESGTTKMVNWNMKANGNMANATAGTVLTKTMESLITTTIN
jgi:hypothetical protein